MKKLSKKAPLPVILLAILLILPTTGQAGAGRDQIKKMVKREAIRLGVPISLALAIAHTESYFDPLALSNKGARGVMQIMPATALGEYGIDPDWLWNPRINIRLGLHFMKRLLKRYKGRVSLALSYYNGGSRPAQSPDNPRHPKICPTGLVPTTPLSIRLAPCPLPEQKTAS
jgi:soluble lytic murein transglycosylase-like protein